MCVSPVIRSLWCVYDVYTNPKGWWKQIRMYWASDRLEIYTKIPIRFFSTTHVYSRINRNRKPSGGDIWSVLCDGDVLIARSCLTCMTNKAYNHAVLVRKCIKLPSDVRRWVTKVTMIIWLFTKTQFTKIYRGEVPSPIRTPVFIG